MGRPRGFSEDAVLDAAAAVFVNGGYEGTSIDDLVKALNLHRGSLYKAFGSKRGLFLAVLQHRVEGHLANLHPAEFTLQGTPEPGCSTLRPDLDLLLVAAVERGHRDPEVAALVRRGLEVIEDPFTDSTDPPQSEAASPPGRAVQLLGARLYERLHLDPGEPSSPNQPTTKEN